MNYTIDATGKTIGRIATEAATLLMGKNTPDFQKNTVAPHKVLITNASKVRITAKKMKTVEHNRYSGYPGGFVSETIEEIVSHKGYAEIFKLAVYGMLPGNKLRPIMMKNLTITE